MRRMDELAAADVDADVTRTCEEEEVARLELAHRNGRPHPDLGVRTVWKRDPDLGVDVHHESRAVEAARRRAAPDVRHAEVMHRDAYNTAVRRRRRDGRTFRRRCRRADDGCGPGR